MSLTDLLRADVTTAAPDTPAADVAAALRDRDESFVVVLDEHRPAGVLSAADLGRTVGDGAAEATAGDLVTETETVGESTDRAALVSAFADTGARHLVVTDDAGDYVGVVSLDDLLAAYGREFTALLDLLADRE